MLIASNNRAAVWLSALGSCFLDDVSWWEEPYPGSQRGQAIALLSSQGSDMVGSASQTVLPNMLDF
jgi:hypothetical protein